jgi:hypothetical protein
LRKALSAHARFENTASIAPLVPLQNECCDTRPVPAILAPGRCAETIFALPHSASTCLSALTRCAGVQLVE